MSLTLILKDAVRTRVRPRGARNTGRTAGRVPMLDWPADLFSDNATMGELMVEDFALSFDPSALFGGQETYSQAA